MRLTFVYWAFEDHGSAQDIYNYTRVAKALGHDVALYGPPETKLPFTCSLDLESADAVVFIFEWTTGLMHGDHLDLVRLMAKVHRKRRVVIDCDGMYNDIISIIGDYNHPHAVASRRWIKVCNSLSDKI